MGQVMATAHIRVNIEADLPSRFNMTENGERCFGNIMFESVQAFLTG